MFLGKRIWPILNLFTLYPAYSMSIVYVPDGIRQILLDDLFHFFCKRTGITDRRTLLYTRSKNYGVCAAFYQLAGTENGLLPGATAAIYKANHFYIFVYIIKRAAFFPYHLKAGRARTIILCLHTSDNTYFHIPNLSFRIVHKLSTLIRHYPRNFSAMQHGVFS